MRLDLLLTIRHNGVHTRSQITNAIKNGQVTVNGNIVCKCGYEVVQNDIIDAKIESQSLTAEPENIKIDIVFEDEYLMLINKPRGMVVHPGNGNKSGTLLNALLGRGINIERAGIVHRLDKNTAGIMVAAKTAETQAKLSAMLERHEIERTYNGIVDGIMHGEGTVDKHIVRDPKHRTLFTVTSAGGRRAVTHYKVLQQFKKHTLVQFKLETGRTHQIRVHCKSVGHPIVGDPEYNPNSAVKCSGQMLESLEISFIHPITGEKIHGKVAPTDEFNGIMTKIC